MSMEFTTWANLATYAGALAMVMVITQFTKGIGFIEKMPSQIWSWIVAMIIMFPAFYFTNQLTSEAVFIIPVNALLVSLASNGSYDAVTSIFKGGSDSRE